ncbi:WecB/TagA/CpsF family glycosyltransferase [Bacillus sp. SCS-151]|uniref:WecB/TagA/CpsF family glycosyltransferase n=1 Tax=Nanhaiella sioensis TaxID=3115293 RepID=UPI00397DF074
MVNFDEVMGYEFVNNRMENFLKEVHNRMQVSQKTFIVTANPEIITYAKSNPSYDLTLKKATYIIPDGAGIVIASKILGKPLKEKLTGIDFMEKLLNIANDHRYKIYLLGAKPDVIGLTAKNIQQRYPHVDIVGFHHGYFDDNDETIISHIKETEPDIVLVGLGFPKQENWIAKSMHNFNKGVFIGLGGSFNVWAGVVKRAPKIWRDTNLEWLYRLIKEPSRLKRMIAIPKFMVRVLKKKYHRR